MEGLEIYQKMAQPPKDALREIKGGRLAGMSDINPQWRYRIMTEMFGLCGIGWKYTIDRTWTEQGADGEIFCFVQISLYIKNGEWSDPIPGIGGNMLISKERNRSSEGSHLYNNDEAYKMALTDALGTAMQRIGVAADVYAGKWDGSKYAQGEELQRGTVKLGKSLEEITKEKAMAALLQYSPEQRKEYYTKHGGLIIGKTPDGKDRWSGINWVALAKELGAINA